MKCPYCGTEIREGAAVCPGCGQSINVEVKENEEYVGPLGSSRPILTWGSLAIGLGWIPVTCFLGILFGIIGLRKAANHARFTGTLLGPARAGKILSIAGIFIGATMMALSVLWLIRLIDTGYLWGIKIR